MTAVRRMLLRLRAVFLFGRMQREMDEEMRAHVERAADRYMARGMSRAEATVAARREFGNATVIASDARDARGARWAEALVTDIRVALRAMRATPALTLVITLTLALGIGATTAIYSIVDGVLLRPLPYRAPESLVVLHDVQRTDRDLPASFPEYVDWRQRTTSIFSDVGALIWHGEVLSGSGDAEQLQGAETSANVLSMLGVTPTLGRAFRADEDLPSAPRVVMLSDDLWKRRFNADSTIIGRSITLTGQPFVVIGVYHASPTAVLPQGNTFAHGKAPDFWEPLRLSERNSPRGVHYISVIARLRPGVTAAAASVRLAAVEGQLEKDRATTHGIAMLPLATELVGNLRAPLALLLGSVVLVLIVACANIANLLLARTTARRRELAVRAALGAGRLRVTWHVLLEGIVRATIGGVCGILLALGTVSAARHFLREIPRISEVTLDVRALLIAAALSIATGMLASLVPALRASRGDLVSDLREGARGVSGGRDRVRHALVIAQIAVSFTLLVTGALLGRSFERLTHAPNGFDPRDLVTASTWLPDSRYPDSVSQIAFNTRLGDAVARRFGATNVALTSDLPVGGGTSGDITIVGRVFAAGQAPMVQKRVVSHGYFSVLHARLVSGRLFAAGDVLGAPHVAIVNEAFVKRWFPTESPLGHQITFDWNTSGPQTIVGVVADVREGPLDQAAPPAVYAPSEQVPNTFMNMIVRTDRDPSGVEAVYRDALREIDPALPVLQVRTMSDWIASGIARRRLTASILGAFAVAALLLAAVGLYGVISYSVTQRMREFGVRAALGAVTGDLVRLVFTQVAGWIVIGVAAGAVAGLAAGKLVSAQLYGITQTDPWAFGASAVLLAIVGGMAAFAPTWRAARADPLEALHAD